MPIRSALRTFSSHARDARSGFTLVELSVVLAIIGLLVGGVFAGQAMIRASELRSVVADFHRFVTSTLAFKEKYNGIPGDLASATSYWGDDNTNCPDAAVANGSPGTCNGNGDGQVNDGAGANVTSETYQYWKQLVLAGFIEGTYTGLAGPASSYTPVYGTNAPTSRVAPGSGWRIRYLGLYTGDGSNPAATYNNHYALDGPGHTKVLRPEELWNIDTKLDDGKPMTGIVIAAYWDDCTTATSYSDSAAVYQLSDTSIQCFPYFLDLF